MLEVSPARPNHYSAALAVLFSAHSKSGQPDQVGELLEASDRGEISLDGLLLAEVKGEPVGAALYVMQPDKTAFVWPPVVAPKSHNDAAEIVDAVYAEMRRQLDAADAWLSQCLVEIDDTAVRAALSRNEFGHLADLCYLQRLVDEPIPQAKDGRLSSVEFNRRENLDQFASMIERTYVDTLDCPGLVGTRNGYEALLSHQTSGQFDPSRWKIYSCNDQEVGVLLLNDHPDQSAWEVVYMGVAPEARGKGFGRDIIIDGIHQVRSAGRSALLLAVDSRNIPAREIYASLGFREIAQRAAHVRIVRHVG